MRIITLVIALTMTLGLAGIASAAAVELPDTSAGTTFTANVSEQCDITVPANVTFNVTDIALDTDSAAQSVDIINIVLASATKQLKVSIQASAANFTPSVALATTWAATDVSWDAPAWNNATGNAASLSSAAYTEVATANADAASCDTAALVFTLAAKTTVKRSGNHTLAATWKVESIGL